jgi:hypothetical protein
MKILIITLYTWIFFISPEEIFPQELNIVTIGVTKKVLISGGETFNISIEIDITEPYHVQANPVNDEYLIPTTIEIIPENEIILGNPIYPPGKLFKLEGTENNLLVYDGKFSIKVAINVLNNVQHGDHTLKGTLHYQACDSLRCFAPRTMPFTIPIKVLKK